MNLIKNLDDLINQRATNNRLIVPLTLIRANFKAVLSLYRAGKISITETKRNAIIQLK